MLKDRIKHNSEGNATITEAGGRITCVIVFCVMYLLKHILYSVICMFSVLKTEPY